MHEVKTGLYPQEATGTQEKMKKMAIVQPKASALYNNLLSDSASIFIFPKDVDYQALKKRKTPWTRKMKNRMPG